MANSTLSGPIFKILKLLTNSHPNYLSKFLAIWEHHSPFSAPLPVAIE